MKRVFTIFLLFLISLRCVGQMENNVAVFDSLRNICDTIQDPRQQEKVYYQMCLAAPNADYVFLYSMKLLNLSRRLGDHYYQGVANSLICWVYSAQNNLGKALEYGMETIDNYKQCDSTRSLILAYNQLGSVYSNMNNIDASLETYRLALNLAHENGMYFLERQASMCIGYVYIDMRLYRFAMDYLIDPNPDTSSRQGYKLWVDSQLGLMEAHLALYNNGDGPQHLDAAYKITKSLNEDTLKNLDAITYLNYTLETPLVYIERSKLKNRKANLDTAEHILRRGEIFASQKSIDLFDSQHKLVQCYILMEKRYYDMIPPLISELDTTIGREGRNELLDVMYDYYKVKRDYVNVLKVLDMKSRLLYTKYNIDFAMKSENSTAVDKYNKEMQEIQDHEKQVIKTAENERKNWQHLKNILVVGIVFILILSLHFIFNSRTIRKTNLLLAAHNLKLNATTQELTDAQHEYQSQCTEILQQTKVFNEQKNELENINGDLHNSLDAAMLMQRAVVPSAQALRRIVGESFVFWRPLDMVSGDFYWTAQRGKRRFMIVADCTGHGVPGALLSILGSSILNSLLPQLYNLDAAQILELYKTRFKETICKNKNIDDGMDLALVVFEDNSRIQYAGANRPLIIIRRGELIEYKPDKICIGNNFYKEHLTFTNYEIQVEPNDVLYAFSDGITDQFGGMGGRQKFSIRALKSLLSDIYDQPMDAQCQYIGNAIDEWRKVGREDGEMYPQIDDELVVGIRIG